MVIDGGVNWDKVATGAGIVGATLIAVACAPASAFVGAAYGAMLVGSVLSGGAAGYFIGSGLAE